jgi:glycosyltransferase involved in cell wall biosynthesis
MKYDFSFIIPVYNRKDEIEELLQSFTYVKEIQHSEILIIEDGSTLTCKTVVDSYSENLHIRYFFKDNTGPGDSRNYGMQRAHSDYFIILDSDVLMSEDYILNLKQHLNTSFVDCFGGPDKAHKDFSTLQKAINYTMTSVFTTGGIRGGKQQEHKFEPRSFNMGMSKTAFQATAGFIDIHPGEDPDLSIRLKKMGFKTALFSDCYVYHKRRIDFTKFIQQVYKFGLVRPILNLWHPDSSRLIYWFPSLFGVGFLFSLIAYFANIYLLLLLYFFYFILIFVHSSLLNKSLIIGAYSVISTLIQFFGYGYGFLKSTFNIFILKKQPRLVFPFLFFKS